MDPVIQVRDALREGRLPAEQLTARGIGEHLGKTTSVVYHHYGSLDLFLFEVGQAGLAVLAERMDAVRQSGGELADLAATFVRFGLETPGLYALMFERSYDWAEIRRRHKHGDTPGHLMWRSLVELLRAEGSPHPLTDARILFGGLHGLVSLALSGRANIGTLEISDEAAAIEAARSLARRLGRRTHDDDPRPAHPHKRPHARKSPRQVGDERAPRRPRRRPR
jgi:AcrR family transcriptional regulator